MRGCRVFLADDKMQKGRSAAIIARYNASVFSFGASNDRSTRAFRLYMDMLILIRASCAPPSRPNPPPSCVGRQTCPHPRALTPGPSPQGPHPRALTPGPSPRALTPGPSHALAPTGRRLHRQPGLHVLRQHCTRARPQPWNGCRLEYPDNGGRKVPGGYSYRYMRHE